MGKYKPVSVAEKRAQLEAAGEEWPIGSDGLPKVWNRASNQPSGGKWRLRSSYRAALIRNKKTAKGRAANARYAKSEKGRAARARHEARPHRKAEQALRELYRIRIPGL